MDFINPFGGNGGGGGKNAGGVQSGWQENPFDRGGNCRNNTYGNTGYLNANP